LTITPLRYKLTADKIGRVLLKRNKISANYIPEKVSKLIKATDKINALQSFVNDLGKDIVHDIIDGWTTGDKLLDFVLVACDGVYDTFTLCLQYRRLADLGLRKPNQRIMVIQKAEYWSENDILQLRNIYLAHIRPVEVEFNIASLCIRIPVEPNYLVLREFLYNDFFTHRTKIIDEKWLIAGRLHNEICDYGAVNTGDSGLISVPDDSVCDIVSIPPDDKIVLYEDHGIDADMLSYLYNTWTRSRSACS
jgi:hypothetical protein